MNQLVYQKGSGTIRQMPQNYGIAIWHPEYKHWVMMPDPAADVSLVHAVTHALLYYKNKWNPDGEEVLKHIKVLEPIGYYISPGGPNGLSVKVKFYEKRTHPELGTQVLIDYLHDGDLLWVNVPDHWIVKEERRVE